MSFIDDPPTYAEAVGRPTSQEGIHYVCCLDISGSMNAKAIFKMQGNHGLEQCELGNTCVDLALYGIKLVYECMEDDDRLSLITFNQYAKIIFKNLYKREINFEQYTEKICASGTTNISAGLDVSLEVALDSGMNSMVLFLSDGKSMTSGDFPMDIIEQYKKNYGQGFSRITINTLAFGYGDIDYTLLSNMAHSTGGFYSYICDVSFIGTVFSYSLANIKNKHESRDGVSDYVESEDQQRMRKNLAECIYNASIDIHDNIDELKTYIDSNMFPGLGDDYSSQIQQLEEDSEKFKKWGRYYLASLASAHRNAMANNFKDQSVLVYSTPRVKLTYEDCSRKFNRMEAPKPRQTYTTVRSSVFPVGRSFQSASQSKYTVADKPKPQKTIKNMSEINNSRAPCIHEDVMLNLQDGTTKHAKNIVPGDMVETNNGFIGVRYVVKTKCDGGYCDMTTLSDILRITPLHPVCYKDTNVWQHPQNVNGKNQKTEKCEFVYSFELYGSGFLKVGDWYVAVLNHGVIGDNILEHDFYGTEKWRSSLPVMDSGIYEFDVNPIKRDENEIVGWMPPTSSTSF